MQKVRLLDPSLKINLMDFFVTSTLSILEIGTLIGVNGFAVMIRKIPSSYMVK